MAQLIDRIFDPGADTNAFRFMLTGSDPYPETM
jgi:hypothetical protein